MMIHLVLSAFNINLLFFIQMETSWTQSLSWFREQQTSGVLKKHRFVCHLHKGVDSSCDSV